MEFNDYLYKKIEAKVIIHTNLAYLMCLAVFYMIQILFFYIGVDFGCVFIIATYKMDLFSQIDIFLGL